MSVFAVTTPWEISSCLKRFPSHWLCFRLLDLRWSSCWFDGAFVAVELRSSLGFRQPSQQGLTWKYSQDVLFRKRPSLTLSLPRSVCPSASVRFPTDSKVYGSISVLSFTYSTGLFQARHLQLNLSWKESNLYVIDSLQHTVWILYYFKRKCWTPCCYTYSPSKKFAYIVCVWESISIFPPLKYEWRNWKLPPFSKTLPGGRSVRHFMFEMTHSSGHLPSLYLVQLDEHRQKQSKTESLCAAVSLWCT